MSTRSSVSGERNPMVTLENHVLPPAEAVASMAHSQALSEVADTLTTRGGAPEAYLGLRSAQAELRVRLTYSGGGPMGSTVTLSTAGSPAVGRGPTSAMDTLSSPVATGTVV